MGSNIVLQTLKHVWLALLPLHLKMALMGGLSVAFWKHPRATRDVDLLVDVPPGDGEKLVEFLEKAKIRSRQEPPIVTLDSSRFLQLVYEPPGSFLDVRIDLMFADSEYQKVALSRTVEARFEGFDFDLAVLACEDLILHKLLGGRLLDRADVVSLLQANPDLDVDYIQGWAVNLSLQEILNETWKTAFPES
jgi:hypothetical protein